GVIGLAAGAVAGPKEDARQILDAAGVKGGLVVHLGCGDGSLTAALRAGDAYLVHGLDTDAANVAKARTHIRSLDLDGAVSVATFDGARLPYIENIVNLVVAEDPGNVPTAEVMRVLAPGGVAYVKEGGGWKRVVKPRPRTIDEWTHYLHDPGNNAVAHDTQVGPPRHLQWQSGPRWSRHHDHMASVSAVVSAGGRVFYILDEGSRVSPQLPADWHLVARDAFSGVLLWKRPIEQWHPQLWPLKSGPANLPRRLVAEGAVVYVTLGTGAPVAAIDAASGKTLCEYPNTAGAEELILSGGVLLVLVNRTPFDMEADLATDPEEGKSRDHRTTYSPYMARIWAGIRSRRWSHGDRVLRAFDAAGGRQLWEQPGPVIPLTLAADADQVYHHNGSAIRALERSTGKTRWTSEPVPVWQGLGGHGLQSWFAPTLVASEGKVLLAGGEKMHMPYVGWGSKDIGEDTMTAFSAKTGEKLWTAPHPYCGYNSPEDLFVIDGKVWAGATAKGSGQGRYVGHDLGSGKLANEFPPTVSTSWFHHRCHRAKATDRYILCSRAGIEFVDVQTGEWTINHWVRGGCLYGIMPANGLLYAPPHPCACYPEAKLYGFVALAAASPSRALPKTIPGGRLHRGPAYGQIRNPKSEIRNPDDWPTYRHDPARSGATASEVPARLRCEWQRALGGRLTPPVAGGGRLFVADLDRCVVHAIDAASGEVLWTHTAGGRVDSPPTCEGGRLFFGSADGYVTALRASDGALAWQFRAAPVDRRLVAFDQVESVWPVHGSVLVQGGIVSAVAGRSMFLDGGLRLCRLNADTGKLVGETVLDDRDPESGKNLQVRIKGLNMPVALPDILASDGECLYMRSQAMDLEGKRLVLGPGGSGRDHLFAPYGFTDDTWFHRVYWLYGDGFQGGIGGYGNGRTNPAGRILASDKTTIFGYGRKPEYYRWSSVIDYQLFATARSHDAAGKPLSVTAKRRKGKPSIAFLWTRDVPMMVRAMALAGRTLLVAGPQDLLDEDAAFQTFADRATQEQLADQDAALAGKRGALMHAVDADTGKTTAEYKMESPPVFDGLIVAGGKVFIVTTDGRLQCWAGQ
ncbi:MAG TPA: PQQ-binding-like beta-propeller repeat protein, partial [Phycisphaerae bacterium]|nr:PQQ-binding-like beta-propeller repeat protein [Phycisphaerae bacterium]